MEKLLIILGAVLMMFSLSMVGFAQNQDTVGATGTGHQTEDWLLSYTGEVISVIQGAHSVVVRGDDGEKVFDVSGATIKGIPEVHHFVTVKYTDMDGKRVASSVNTVPKKVASRMKWLYEQYVS